MLTNTNELRSQEVFRRINYNIFHRRHRNIEFGKTVASETQSVSSYVLRDTRQQLSSFQSPVASELAPCGGTYGGQLLFILYCYLPDFHTSTSAYLGEAGGHAPRWRNGYKFL